MALESNGDALDPTVFVLVDTGDVADSIGVGESDCFLRLGCLLAVEVVDFVMGQWW